MIDSIQFFGYNGQVVTLNTDVYPMTMFDSQVETETEENMRPAVHGLFTTFSYMRKRTIHMEGDIFGSNPYDVIVKREQLLGPFIPQPELGFRASGILVIQYTGFPESVQCECFLDGLPQAPIEALSPTRASYTITLQTFDPIMYGTNQIIAKSGLPGGSGGFTFPINFPLSFGLGQGGGGGDVNVNNTGNMSVYPTVTIYGPCNTPGVILRTGGKTFSMVLSNLILNTGDYVILDFKNRTVTTNTVGSAYSFVQAGSVWWLIPPGTSTISFTAFAASGAAHAEIAYSNGYML